MSCLIPQLKSALSLTAQSSPTNTRNCRLTAMSPMPSVTIVLSSILTFRVSYCLASFNFTFAMWANQRPVTNVVPWIILLVIVLTTSASTASPSGTSLKVALRARDVVFTNLRNTKQLNVLSLGTSAQQLIVKLLRMVPLLILRLLLVQGPTSISTFLMMLLNPLHIMQRQCRLWVFSYSYS